MIYKPYSVQLKMGALEICLSVLQYTCKYRRLNFLFLCYSNLVKICLWPGENVYFVTSVPNILYAATRLHIDSL